MHAHLCSPADDDRGSLALRSSAHCLLEPVDGGPGLLLTLWPDEAAARDADAVVPGRVLEVEDVHGQPPSGPGALPGLCGSLIEFDGPRDARQVDADRRADRERIWPAASQVPGTLGALVLRAPDGAMVVVALAEHVRALAATPDVIMSTPLLPGEDPALLRGPDRHGEHRVRDGGLVALLTAAVPAGAPR